MIDYAIICDRLGLLGAADHDTYERMVETWWRADPSSGVAQPEPPSEEECAAEWERYLVELQARAEPLRTAIESGARLVGADMVTAAEAGAHLGW